LTFTSAKRDRRDYTYPVAIQGTDVSDRQEYATMSLVSELRQSTTNGSATVAVTPKSVLDYILACLLAVLAGPVIVTAMFLVRLTSRGPMIYRQVRLGLNGEQFIIYKIRTMQNNCERLTGPQWSTPGDTRVTRIGRILRATHIDELPQLWNILRGEMSLVGPRPERPEIAVGLEPAILCYRDRLQVRPGVTGLAQVRLSPDTDVESVRRKLAYDLYYLEHQSLWLDLRIIAATALAIAKIPSDWVNKCLRIPDSDVVERAYLDRSGELATIPQGIETLPQINMA
jgi:lipopolysaccharide/colanic/teichoic acid biosynthesis glycosyltransferase